jgi:hypothetical protein
MLSKKILNPRISIAVEIRAQSFHGVQVNNAGPHCGECDLQSADLR